MNEPARITIRPATPEDAGSYYALLKSLEEHPDSVALKVAMADLCQGFRATTASNRYYEEVVKSNVLDKNPELADHVRSRIGLNAYLNEDLDEAEDLFSEHVKDYPKSVDKPMHLFLLTRICLMKKNRDDAKRYFGMLESEFPSNQHTAWAKNLFEQIKDK